MSSFWCCMTDNLFSFFPFLSLCVFIHLSALPSICQSAHLSASICHFPCQLNHPSIRPSIFQATHSSAFQSIPSSFICPSRLLWAAGVVVISTSFSAELWWQILSREAARPPTRSCAFTQIEPNTPVRLTTHQHTLRHAASHDLMYLLFSPYMPGELLLLLLLLAHTLEGKQVV